MDDEKKKKVQDEVIKKLLQRENKQTNFIEMKDY